MANNILGNLGYKSIESTNYKADIINERLNELKVVYQIIANCEHCKSKLIAAVKGGANLPAPEPTATRRIQNEVPGRQI